MLGTIAIPAGALRAACVGGSCSTEPAQARVPFCPLPDWMKRDVAAGYYEGRSPDVLAVTARSGMSAAGDGATPWPSVADGPSVTRVPIALWGRGVRTGARVPAGTKLDAIAPTIADAISLVRGHPDVRSGTAIPGVADPSDAPRLVVEVGLIGVGSDDVAGAGGRWPTLDRLIREGAGTVRGDTGSLPLDPAATLTTIGTGGLPSQHGITGSLIRSDDGRVVAPWSASAPPSVIATLADDLDHETHDAARVGLVAPSPTDRGLIGGTWYPNHPRDDVAIVREPSIANVVLAVRRTLGRGYGTDDVPDVLGVAFDGRAPGADRALASIVDLAERASHAAALVAVAGTGTTAPARGGDGLLEQVESSVPGDARVVAGVVPGGLFLDQRVLSSEHVTGQAVVDALLGASTPDGDAVVRDAFQGFAVSFARYC